MKHVNRNHIFCLFNPINIPDKTRKVDDNISTYKLIMSLV